MGPGAAVEVVGPDARPGVVDDAHLGVHVDRRPRVVLDPVGGHPSGRGRHDRPERPVAAEQLGHPGRPVDVGVERDHHDEPQLRVVPQRGQERVGDVVPPEVLVLDVDQLARPGDGLGVAPGDAALAAAGEREVPPVTQVGVGAQQLDGMRAGLRRGRLLVGEGVGVDVEAAHPVGQLPQRAAAERRGVLPALAEHGLDVVDRGALDLHLEVVPRRVRPVLLGQRLGLRVAVVVGVVATVVREVDAADEGQVAGRVVAVPDDDELLVVGPARRVPACPAGPRRPGAGAARRGAGSRWRRTRSGPGASARPARGRRRRARRRTPGPRAPRSRDRR